MKTFLRFLGLFGFLIFAVHSDAQLFIQKPGLVQVTNSGTAIAVSFTNQLSTSTNVAIANVTAANPFPVYMPTNNSGTNISVLNNVNLSPTNVIGVTLSGNMDLDPTNIIAGITGDINLSATNVIHVTIDGGTNTLEVSAAIPTYLSSATNIISSIGSITSDINLNKTNVLAAISGDINLNKTNVIAAISGDLNLNKTNVIAAVTGDVNLNKTNILAGITGDINLNSTNRISVNTQTNIGGFTLVGAGDFPVDKISTNIIANDAFANVVQVANAVRTSNGTGLLTSLCCVSGDNRAPAFTLLISADALTGWITNAAANLVQTEIATNLLGIVDFATSDFKQIGTNYIATKGNLNIGVKPLATTLYLYAVSQMSITNTNAYTLKWTILQD